MADIISLSSLAALAVLLPWLWFRHRKEHRKALREEADLIRAVREDLAKTFRDLQGR